MIAKPRCKASVKGITVVMLGTFGAWLLSVHPACGQQAAGSLKAAALGEVAP